MRVVLAMSGGVDSSVAAHLLLAAGHEVIGVFMRHGEKSPAACSVSRDVSSPEAPPRDTAPRHEATREGAPRHEATRTGPARSLSLPVVSRLDHKQGCCTAADAEDARRVADRLAIPFYALDLSEEFGRVMDYFAAEYARGRTPNPCVRCNDWIKFGKLFDYADAVGAERVATGHYARVEPRGGEPALLRGVDASKDQSYVLAGVRRELLQRMLLPVGAYEKPAIRALAARVGLDIATKRDSQEICFVTQGRYDQFVKRRLKAQESEASRVVPTPEANRSGDLVTTDGRIVGRHDGVEGFTVGQRKGLGVALGERTFVVRIEPDTKRVVLGDRADLLRDRLSAIDANWLTELPMGTPLRCHAQVRYNSSAHPATLTLGETGRFEVAFDAPATSITPGQAVVCYAAEDPDRVLGGGWIE